MPPDDQAHRRLGDVEEYAYQEIVSITGRCHRQVAPEPARARLRDCLRG